MSPEDGTISLAPKEKALLELQNLNSGNTYNLEQVRLQTFQVTVLLDSNSNVAIFLL